MSMKIALTTPYYPPHIGGIEVHVKTLAEKLKGKGYEVEVISSTGRDGEIHLRRIPSIPIPYSPIPIFFPDVEADVYHSHIPAPFFARRIKNKPHIITYHNEVVIPEKVGGIRIPRFFADRIEKMNEKLVTPVLDRAEIIIATTKSYAESSPMLRDYMNKVEIVPNGVDPERFNSGSDAGKRGAIVLYVGRLVEYKGLHILIKAMSAVQDVVESVLVVIGDGEDRKTFEFLAKQLAVNIEFKGRVADDEVVAWMKKARVLVLPSQSILESFGIVLLEAMACKTPVIASKLPGVMEVAREGGLIFEDETDLAEKLIELLTNETLTTSLGLKGRCAVEEKYSWDVIVRDRIEKIYDAVRVRG